MNNPEISIIMPVYNGAEYLLETVGAIQAQTFRDYEVICVDDGSTDESPELLRQISEADCRFRVLRQKNAGAGAARNYGFPHARGEYVIFLDSDDLFDADFLKKMLDAIKKQKADIAACDFSRFYPDGSVTEHEGIRLKWLPEGTKVFSYRDCPDYIMRVVNPTPWNKLYRTEFIRTHGFRFDEISSTNDVAFASVTVAAADRIAVVAESLVQYRVGHGGTISATKTKKLDNVSYAIDSAVRQTAALPHSGELKNAIQSFVVDNYITALSRYITDFSDPIAAAFYQHVHERFGFPELADVTAKTLNNPKQFRQFCTVRKHDYQTMKKLISRRLVVSLTTYPKRISLIPKVLRTIYRQPHKKADEVVLWLAEEQFPGKEQELPESVLELVDQGQLTIRWCDDLKPHKKYFYALQEYTEDLVVTIDDDLWYTWNTLETLYESYLLYPEAVSTVRAHLIMLDEENRILPYKSWIQETDACIYEPNMQLMATGGAGVLYPPGLYRKEFFDKRAIREICLYADDLWLKAMQLASDVPVVVARPHEQLLYLEGSQEEALKDMNVGQNQNDVQLQQIIEWMDRTFEPGLFLKKLTEPAVGRSILGVHPVAQHLDTERKSLRKKLSLAEGKSKQMEKLQKKAEEVKQAEIAKRIQAENSLAQSREDLQRTKGDLQKTNQELQRTKTDFQIAKKDLDQNRRELQNTQAQLRKTQEEKRRTEEKLEQTSRSLRVERDWHQKTRSQLEKTKADLQETRYSKPVGRQLKAVGAELTRQREEGRGGMGLAFKYLLYGLAWIPEKILAGTMFYLKNGGKETLKQILRRVRRG